MISERKGGDGLGGGVLGGHTYFKFCIYRTSNENSRLLKNTPLETTLIHTGTSIQITSSPFSVFV